MPRRCSRAAAWRGRTSGRNARSTWITKDSDDVEFLDFKISVRIQLAPEWTTKGLNGVWERAGDNTGLYLAFAGRFGQYIGTRDSAPVIGKRFNPKIFARHWTGADRRASRAATSTASPDWPSTRKRRENSGS